MNTRKIRFGVRDGMLRTIVHGAFIALVPVVSAVTLPAQTTAKSNGMMSGHPSADSAQAIVSLLATANRDEVAAGRLAASKAKRADVKAFAQRMVAEHGAALAKLTSQSQSGGWMVPDSSAMSGMVGSSDMSRMNGKRDSSNMKGGMRDTSGMSKGNMRNGRDTTMGLGSGLGADAMAVHSANLADMKKLNAASGDSFDSMYIASQMKGHQTLLDKLNRYNTSNTTLQATVSETKTAINSHLAALRKMQQSSTGMGNTKP